MKLLLTTIRSACPETELALKYLNSIVETAPCETTLKPYDEISLDCDIFEEIVSGQFNIVYFQCDEFNEHRLSRLAEMVKKAIPTAVVVVGGKHVAYNTKGYMKANPYVDYVIRGEVEVVFFSFLKTILTYEFSFDDIPGLAFRNDDEIVVNGMGESIAMEELPFPYETNELGENEIVYYETMRGTTDYTIFTPQTVDTKVRVLPLGRVCTELRYFLAKKAEKVIFLDRWINFNEERCYRIFEFLISNDNGYTTFVMDVDGDKLDEETVRLLSEAREGLFEFNVEIGSTNAETLAAMGRRENVFQLLYNVTKLLQAAPVKVNVSITAGLPMENEKMFARSFNKVYGLVNGKGMNIRVAQVKRGTIAAKEASRIGYLYSSASPHTVIATSHMTALELIRIKSIAKITDRYIDAGFDESLKRIMNDLALKPYNLFAGLNDYIDKAGLEKKLDKLENMYRILYNYAAGLYDDQDDTLKLQILADVLHDEMETKLTEEEVVRFERKGWDIEA